MLLKIQCSGLIGDKQVEKLFAGMYIIAIVLSFSCGGLLLNITALDRQNSDLKTNTDQLENQINVLEKETSDLEDQVEELAKQLEAQTYQKNLEYAKQVKITEIKLGPDTVESSLVAAFDIYVTVKNFGTNNAVELAVSTSSGETKPTEAEAIEQVKAGGTAKITLRGSATWWERTEAVTLWFNDVLVDLKQIDY